MAKGNNVVPITAKVDRARPPVVDNRPIITSPQEGIDWLNKEYFTTYLNGQYRVVRENPDGTIEIMDRTNFISGLDEMRLLIETEKGNKSVPITDYWLRSADRALPGASRTVGAWHRASLP
jgi:hypothetical protein